LAYGFPGTGKTTTVMNIVNKYFEIKSKTNMADVIHLNASDDRGIDLIRNQIQTFATSKSLFTSSSSLKFIILDEVDYMTKTAQQALKYLIQTCNEDIRFFLICNYISRIDDGLQNDFLKIHFSVVPPQKINAFLHNISDKENLDYTDEDFRYLRFLFSYDIRSMINFMQMNQHVKPEILNSDVFGELWSKFVENAPDIQIFITDNCHRYNMDVKRFVLYFLHFMMKEHQQLFFSMLSFIENLLHNKDVSNKDFLAYFQKSLLKRISITTHVK
jgi:replication factor C subunit 3/5